MKKYLLIIIILYCYPASFTLSDDWDEITDKFNRAIESRNYREAVNLAGTALTLADSVYGDSSEIFARALGYMGQAFYMSGSIDKAINYMSRETGLKRAILGTNNPSYALSVNNLAVAYQALGRFREAEPLLLEALEIKRRTVGEKDTSYAKSLNNLGQLYFSLGNYSAAESYFQNALKIKREIIGEYSPSYAATLINTAVLCRTLGNYEQARSNSYDAVKILEEMNDPSNSQLADARYEYAMALIAGGNEQEAHKVLLSAGNDRIIPDFSNIRDYARSLYNIGLLNWSLKNYKEAEKQLEETLALVDKNMGNAHPLYSACLNALGVIAWQDNKLEKARSLLTKAALIREKVLGEYHPDYATSLHNLAGLLKDLGHFSEANTNYRKAMSLYLYQIRNYFPFLSDAEKTRFYTVLKQRFDMFFCYVASHIKDEPELSADMYNYIIATKGVLLSSLKSIRQAVADTKDTVLKAKFGKWLSLKTDLAAIYTMTRKEAALSGLSPDSLENAARELEKEISAKTGFIQRMTENQGKWQDIKKALKPDEAAVEIVRFNYIGRNITDTVFYAALAITSETRDYPRFVILDNGKYLEERSAYYYRSSIAAKTKDPGSFNDFWSRIDAILYGKKRLYIARDGIYNIINLNTLQDDEGRYMIDKYEIIYLSNTVDILNASKPHKAIETAALFGYPEFFNESSDNNEKTDSYISVFYNPRTDAMRELKLADIPGAKEEVEKIADILKNEHIRTMIYTGSMAGEAVLKSIKSPDILHIATHGFFLQDIGVTDKEKIFGIDIEKARENPLLRSGLLLSGAGSAIKADEPAFGDNNGIFTSYEAMNMNLEGTRLVVLSACETGLGQIMNGEGVYGLQRAFMAAGAENVLMSLWNINDLAARELMTSFYSYWMKGQTISRAFRNAQLDLKAEYHDPYYWGAFVLSSGED